MSSDIVFDQAVEIPDILKSGDVVTTLVGERTRLSLRVKAADRIAVAKALGITLPAKIGKTNTKAGIMIACLGPDEWFIVGEKAKYSNLYNKALKLSSKYVMSVTDVSFRNVAVELTGPKVAEIVNVGCPLDLSLAAFPVGKCTRTVYEAAPIILHRLSEDSFAMECWRSYAPYMVGLMTAHVQGQRV